MDGCGVAHQVRFPKPAEAAGATLRFKMDGRYAPRARGGNPCVAAQADPSHICRLCTAGFSAFPDDYPAGLKWDHAAKRGIYILWSTPGADSHVISGPVDVLTIWEAFKTTTGQGSEPTVTLDSPAELDLTNKTELIVTWFAYSQYPFTGELDESTDAHMDACKDAPHTKNPDESDGPDGVMGGNVLLAITAAGIITRPGWSPASEPPDVRPRLHGVDASWINKTLRPFFDAECTFDTPTSPGWGWKAGFPDVKSAFQMQTIGYQPCFQKISNAVPPATYREHRAWEDSYGKPDYRSYINGHKQSAALAAWHLVRRLKACHAGLPEAQRIGVPDTDASPCQFDAAATQEMVDEIVRRELLTFDPDAAHKEDNDADIGRIWWTGSGPTHKYGTLRGMRKAATPPYTSGPTRVDQWLGINWMPQGAAPEPPIKGAPALALADPTNAGCAELGTATDATGRAVVVGRSRVCDIATQAFHAQQAGAVALVVVNDRHDPSSDDGFPTCGTDAFFPVKQRGRCQRPSGGVQQDGDQSLGTKATYADCLSKCLKQKRGTACEYGEKSKTCYLHSREVSEGGGPDGSYVCVLFATVVIPTRGTTRAKATAAATVLTAASTDGFVAGVQLTIAPGDLDKEELNTIATVDPSTNQITLEYPLAHDHAAGTPVKMGDACGDALGVTIPVYLLPMASGRELLTALAADPHTLVTLEPRETAYRVWGWEQNSDGCCGFDLQTAATIRHFAHFVDIFGADIRSFDAAALAAVETKLLSYIDSPGRGFLQMFANRHWSLWNGNNWTPVLCEGAMYWAVAYWHEDKARATQVIRVINDISAIHKGMIGHDGGYKEGVCQYSYMSVNSQLGISSLYFSAFDEPWPTADPALLQSMARWQVDSHDTAGKAIDFGDSHNCRGTNQVTLFAALAPEIVGAAEPGTVELDPCLVRSWASSAYYLQCRNPFVFWPAFVSRAWKTTVDACDPGSSAAGIRPLGSGLARIYPDTGYGMLRLPLLAECTADSAERWGCSNATATLSDPKLLDLGIYSMLALQARPNEFPHSEVDFATFKWSAFGVTLLGELGYGTIATSTGPYDLRRYAIGRDNTPASHNTIVIGEAYHFANEAFDDEINYSQMSHERGTIALEAGAEQADAESAIACVHLDGSEVYGSVTNNGWFQYMHRWACPIVGGSYLLVDAFAVKPGRGALFKYGSLYAASGGFDFQEQASGNYTALTADEYFHSPSWLNGRNVRSWSDDQKAFDALPIPGVSPPATTYAEKRLQLGRCEHVEPSLAPDRNSASVLLRSRCAFSPDKYREGDAVGLVTGWSHAGGKFIVDGPVSQDDAYGGQTKTQNRFRYVSDEPVGPTGDLRAFLLEASVGVSAARPASWVVGCGNGNRWCVRSCSGAELTTITVTMGGDAASAASIFRSTEAFDCAKGPAEAPTGPRSAHGATPAPSEAPTKTGELYGPSAAPTSLAPSTSPSSAPTWAGETHGPSAVPTTSAPSTSPALRLPEGSGGSGPGSGSGDAGGVGGGSTSQSSAAAAATASSWAVPIALAASGLFAAAAAL